MPISGRRVSVLLSVALCATAGESRAALPAADQCLLRKIKEVSRLSKCLLKVEVREVRSESAIDTTGCFDRIEEQFTAIDDRFGSGVCPSFGDGAEIGARMGIDLEETVTLLGGGVVSS